MATVYIGGQSLSVPNIYKYQQLEDSGKVDAVLGFVCNYLTDQKGISITQHTHNRPGCRCAGTCGHGKHRTLSPDEIRVMYLEYSGIDPVELEKEKEMVMKHLSGNITEPNSEEDVDA